MIRTREETYNKLQEIRYWEDIEQAHFAADNVLIDFLRDLGYEDIAEAYGKMSKWYS